jgi:hypothetical protein
MMAAQAMPEFSPRAQERHRPELYEDARLDGPAHVLKAEQAPVGTEVTSATVPSG